MADFPSDIVELEETFTYELGLLEYLAPRGHSSGLPLPGLLAHLLVVGGTVLLEILSLLSGPSDECNSEYVFQLFEAHRNKIKALHKNFLFNV
jgi:hypothetical protein